MVWSVYSGLSFCSSLTRPSRLVRFMYGLNIERRHSVSEVSSQDLIAAASRHGYTVRTHQLAHWQRQALLPTPRQEHLGHGRGSVTWYPAGTETQLLALLEAHDRHRTLSHVAWDLWWKGYPVGEVLVRQFLLASARKLDQVVEYLRNPETDGLSDDAIKLLDSQQWHLPQPMAAQIRGLPPGYGDAIMETGLQLLAGTYEGLPDIPQFSLSPVAAFERALGLGRARTDHWVEGGPWLTGSEDEVAAHIGALAQMLQGLEWEDMAQSLPWGDLSTMRDQLCTVSTFLDVFSTSADQALGRNAFGFSVVRQMLRRMLGTPFGQVLALLIWGLLRGDPAVREGQTKFAHVAATELPRWERSSATYAALAQVFPDGAHLFELAADLRTVTNPEARETRMRELRSFRASHAAALDQFFAEHPEFRVPPDEVPTA